MKIITPSSTALRLTNYLIVICLKVLRFTLAEKKHVSHKIAKLMDRSYTFPQINFKYLYDNT